MNTSGLWYRFFAVGGIILLLPILIILLDVYIRLNNKKNNRENKKSKKELIREVLVVSFCFIIGLSCCIHYSYRAVNPEVKCYEGYFEYSNRNSRVAPPLPLTDQFTFSNENDKYKKGFYLDVISKKTIFEDELKIGSLYRVWYEGSTKIILKIELIEYQ